MSEQIGSHSGRRHESLAERQARVGIVANPHAADPVRPLPRDVWTRWPDLRSAKRRARNLAVEETADPESLDAFVRSVRRTRPHHNRGQNVAELPDRAWLRRLCLRLVAVSLFLLALFYWWRILWAAS